MQSELSIYIHWPFCASKCPYCDFNSHVSNNINLQDYEHAYQQEILFFKDYLVNKKIKSIFFGGGTPSLMPPHITEQIINNISKIAKLDNDCEITLEANPTSTEYNKFKSFKLAGINRLSLGIQSLNEQDLKFLGRQHNTKEAIKAIETAREVFDEYSFDLIYARPKQELSLWEIELKQALKYAKNHLSLYQLTIEKGTKFYSDFRNKKFFMPDNDEKYEFYKLTQNIMKDFGFNHYEVSNFAKPNFESKHNLTYWRYQDYLGFGAGAHSRINNQEIIMFHKPEKWLNNIKLNNNAIQTKENITNKQMLEELLLMGLRISEGIKLSRFTELFGKKYDELLLVKKITSLVNENYIEITDEYLRTTNKGRYVLNSVLSYLLAED